MARTYKKVEISTNCKSPNFPAKAERDCQDCVHLGGSVVGNNSFKCKQILERLEDKGYKCMLVFSQQCGDDGIFGSDFCCIEYKTDKKTIWFTCVFTVL